MKFYNTKIICLVFMIFISGCSTRENVPISQTFFAKPSKVMIAQISGFEKPGFYRRGQQGIVDFVISDLMTTTLQEELSKINSQDVLENYYYKMYSTILTSCSCKETAYKHPISKETLQSSPIEDEQHAPYDFRFLKKNNGSEYAFIVEPHVFGISRPYYGFIPTGSPVGYAHLSIYLVNLSDNSILGEYTTIVEEKAAGEWDAPPQYSSLMKACKDALAKALSNAYIFFFRDDNVKNNSHAVQGYSG